MMIAETCAEGSARPAWLHYVAGEVTAAREAGIPLLGICLYPVLDYPGWTNARACDVGLIGRPVDRNARAVYALLARELSRLRRDMETAEHVPLGRNRRTGTLVPAISPVAVHGGPFCSIAD
jgi:hypothetical protein